MSRRAPRITVLLATFNGERFLADQLESIATQSYGDWQLIAADDGSKDATHSILSEFAVRHSNRVRLLSVPPVGSARDNFLRLLRMGGDSDYVALCDQDDVWEESRLSTLLDACAQIEKESPGLPCLVFSDMTVVDHDLKEVGQSFMRLLRIKPTRLNYRTILVENAIPGCCMLLNHELVRVMCSREFDSSRVIMHDWWISLLAFTVGRVAFVPESLSRYRQHTANVAGVVDRSGMGFMVRRLVTLDRRETLARYDQAQEFVHTYGDLIDVTVRDDLAAFAKLGSAPKARRVQQILSRRILKQALARRIYQLLTA